jgi:hypothetical protein
MRAGCAVRRCDAVGQSPGPLAAQAVAGEFDLLAVEFERRWVMRVCGKYAAPMLLISYGDVRLRSRTRLTSWAQFTFRPLRARLLTHPR